MRLVSPKDIIERQLDKAWDGEYIDTEQAAHYSVLALEHEGFVIIHRGY